MATEVTLPALGESVTEGTVTQWLKSVGDTVEVDEPLLEVSTDKVDTEVPSPVAGVLLEIKVAQDETAAVGAALAIIGAPIEMSPPSSGVPAAEPTTARMAARPPEPEPVAPEPDSAPAWTPVRPTAAARIFATPLARKLAVEHGVDLAGVRTSVSERIHKRHIVDAAAAQAAAAVPTALAVQAAAPTPAAPSGKTVLSRLLGKTEKLSRLRRTIAARMVESLRVSAQLTTVVEVDVTEIARLRARNKDAFYAREGIKLTFLPFFAKAAIEALKAYPQLNSSLDADTVTYYAAAHLGVAVDTDRGLIVPVIQDAGDLSIAGLARKIADVADRTRTNKISPDELSGGTFTLTNTGSVGALFDTPIINQPQVAILGTGAVVKRAVVVTDAIGSDSIAVRSMVYLALTYDHRIVDGADAARFLVHIKRRLEGAAFEDEFG